MLDLKPQDGGVSFPVRVSPRASREELGPVREGALCARLCAPPVENAANQALVALLAKRLGVPKGRVRVIAGQKSRQKRVLVEGLAPDVVLGLLAG